MTARNFGYVSGGGDVTQANITPTSNIRGNNINDQELLSRTVNPTAVFKNYGYYVSGAAWETWISIGVPSTANPSGHALTNVQNVKVA